jgi:hypothetical protein
MATHPTTFIRLPFYLERSLNRPDFHQKEQAVASSVEELIRERAATIAAARLNPDDGEIAGHLIEGWDWESARRQVIAEAIPFIYEQESLR